MKRIESSLTNMVLVLLVICGLSAAALGATYGLTQPRLIALEQARRLEAIRSVLPAFDNDPLAAAIVTELGTLFPAESGGSSVGAAVQVAVGGYGGDVVVMVGFDADARVNAVSVLSHSETPGLGARITEPQFLQQFADAHPAQNAVAVAKDGGAIDALTAATISSRAVATAVNTAAGVHRAESAR